MADVSASAPVSQNRRVLSIQSHVVYGYVGNKAATFPLQVLGFDVDPLNAVHFSNHGGYPTVTGERLEGAQVAKIVQGLEANGILQEYSHLLTGYIGRASTLEVVSGLVKKLRAANPALTFVLDPVMGDDGRLYVSAEVVPIYRDVLCPLADVITPNGFETSLLTGVNVTSTQTAIDACEKLHVIGVPTVIITSAELQDRNDQGTSEVLHLIASHRPSSTRFVIPFQKISGVFTGTGDLFAALILAHLADVPQNRDETAYLKRACERAVACMQGVLKATVERNEEKARRMGIAGSSDKATFLRCHELAIVQARVWLESPKAVCRATDI
ncbi:pyridoxal kinase [Spizellomyces sp. 'palustris']|nr:pyridoxal kinase [Spizellomyces sp. 'palustris']